MNTKKWVYLNWFKFSTSRKVNLARAMAVGKEQREEAEDVQKSVEQHKEFIMQVLMGIFQ